MYLRKLWVTVILIEVIICHIELAPNSMLSMVSSRVSLAKCIGTVARNFFVEDKISLVSLSILSGDVIISPIASDGLMLQELFKENNLTVVIKKINNIYNYEKFSSKVGNYIIQIRRSHEIRDVLFKLQSFPTWNSQAKFLVISPELFEDPDHVADHVISELRLAKIVNGVVLLRDVNNNDNYLAYSWKPYSDSNCERSAAKIKIIDQCNFGNLSENFNWFSNKVSHDLNGCTFKVRAIVWPPYVLASDITNNKNKIGIEARLIQTMAETRNFSIEISSSSKEQNWGSIFTNGSLTGTILLLKQEQYDIAIGSFAGTVERHQYLDYVTYNVPESLTWCVPHATDVDQWKKLLMVIPGAVWLLIIIMYLLISVCLWRLSRYNKKESTSYRNLLNSMQNSFSVLVSIAVRFQPKTVKTRLLFFLWAYFTLHIAALYQSTLISVLTKPKYEQKITTIDDIFESKLNMWLLRNNQRYFRDISDYVNKNILQKSHDCNDIEMCLNDTAFGRESATCTPRLYMKFAANQYSTEKGQPLLYCFKESIVAYPLEMFLTKNFPLKLYFSILIGRITAAGLIEQWEKEIFEIKHMKTAYNTKTVNEYQLSLSQIQSVFIILAIGIFFAIIVFIAELYTFKYYQH